MLGGLAGIRLLPVEQYPDIAPPSVNVRANYPGASAETLESSVTQIIEQQLTGIDGLIYFSSSSSSNGSATVTLTFDQGTDADIAQVQVQNKVQQALPRLPQAVQQQGLVVTKSNPDFLHDHRRSTTRPTTRPAPTSPTTWSRTCRIRSAGMPRRRRLQRVRLAVRHAHLARPGASSPASAHAGRRDHRHPGAEHPGGRGPDRRPAGAARADAERHGDRAFAPHQPRSNSAASSSRRKRDGSTVRLADVARVELGSESYSTYTRLNGHPGAGMAVQLAPGADALRTSELVKNAIVEAAKSFPPAIATPSRSTAPTS